MSSRKTKYQFVDIGANLLDDRYTKGEYYGKQRHEPDFHQVLERSIEHGVTHVILTAGTVEESKTALQVVRQHRQNKSSSSLFLGCTVGVHPTRCQQEFVDKLLDDDVGTTTNSKTADDVLQELLSVAMDGVSDGCVVALGEIGLDYDRLEFSSKEVQEDFFKRQLHTFLASSSLQSLPLFLHNRSVGRDLLDILKSVSQPIKGVVHSFDDTIELAQEFIELGFYIGLNGCSLKTAENLDVVRALPLDKILLETDCPYCEIKPTHAGFQYIRTKFEKKVEKKFELGKGVKGRNEPCQIVQVAEVIAGVKNVPVEEVAKACHQNSMDLYSFSSSAVVNG
jgi:TatD DNase family protein